MEEGREREREREREEGSEGCVRCNSVCRCYLRLTRYAVSSKI